MVTGTVVGIVTHLFEGRSKGLKDGFTLVVECKRPGDQYSTKVKVFSKTTAYKGDIIEAHGRIYIQKSESDKGTFHNLCVWGDANVLGLAEEAEKPADKIDQQMLDDVDIPF